MHGSTRIGWLALVALLMAAPAALAAEANAIHQRLLTLDSHLDTPMSFERPGWSMMDAHTYVDDLSQVDYPRMLKGGLDGGFFAIYTGQGPRTPEGYAAARDAALKRAVGNPRDGGAQQHAISSSRPRADDAGADRGHAQAHRLSEHGERLSDREGHLAV